MTRKKSEDAVSPVIGVMLMLVVVIVVGAVVTVFATGLVGDTEVAPVAKLKVEIISEQPIGGTASGVDSTWNTGTVPTLHLTHISGDPVDTADLKLSFAWDCDSPSCSVKHHTSTYQYTKKFGYAYSTGGTVTAFGMQSGKDIHVPANYGAYIQPLYINYGLNSGNGYGVSVMDGAYFGDHVLQRGETMMAYDLHLMIPIDGMHLQGNPAMDALFNNGKIICTADIAYTTEIPQSCPKCGAEADMEGNGYLPGEATCNTCKEAAVTEYGEDYVNLHPELYSGICKNPDCPAQGLWTDDDGVIWNTIMDDKCSECGTTYGNFVLSGGTGYTAGIMACLPEGTPVNVIITHIPSGNIIYEDRVFVE